jgi:hypothetical protein
MTYPYPISVSQIDAAISALAANPDYGSYLKIINLPHQTAEGRIVKCIQIGKGDIPVLITGGMHAREWAPPDATLAFAQKILESYQTNQPFRANAFAWTTSPGDTKDPGYTGPINFPAVTMLDAATVRRIIERLKLFIIPCVNPDGRQFTLDNQTDLKKSLWRKNRRDLGVPCGEIGVDINRNFPAGWDYQRYYDTAAATNYNNVRVETDPCFHNTNPDIERNRRDTYHGPSPASEAEAQNVKSIIESNGIKFFFDIHSFQRKIYYPWGLNPNQITDDTQTILNTVWDRNLVTGAGGRPLNKATTYGEFFPTQILLDSHINCANLMRDKIRLTAGADAHAINRSDYLVEQSFQLYSAPGDSVDFVFSTQLETNGSHAQIKSQYPTHAFTIEVGTAEEGGFQPLMDQYFKIQREVWAAMSALTAYAANWSPTASSSSNSKLCFIATAVYGNSDHEKVQFLRYFRDVEMQGTVLSASIMGVISRIYNANSPRIARYLLSKTIEKFIVRWLFIEPIIGSIWFSQKIAGLSKSKSARTYLMLLTLFGLAISALSFVIALLRLLN